MYTLQDYKNKTKELSSKYKVTINVGFDYENKPCLQLLNADKAKTLKEMNVAKGYQIRINPELLIIRKFNDLLSKYSDKDAIPKSEIAEFKKDIEDMLKQINKT